MHVCMMCGFADENCKCSKVKGMDKTEIHDELIYPLMDKIIEICREHEIDLVATFQLEQLPDGNYIQSSTATNFNPCDRLKAARKCIYDKTDNTLGFE